MPYRNRTYVAFDADNDIHYYRLMLAWKQNDNTEFDFRDAHDLKQARDTSSEDTIKRSLQYRMANSKAFVLLVGSKTRYLYKFVRWEIEQAMAKELPIICVNLNGLRQQDEDRCPPIIRSSLALHVSFNASILQKALEDWTILHYEYMRGEQTGPYYYNNEIYRGLGL